VQGNRWCALGVALGLCLAGSPRLVAADAGANEPQRPQVARFEFGLFGNQRRDDAERSRFPRLMAAINRADLAFSVDDGGIGSAPADCTDDYDLESHDLFDRFRAPLLYTPGQSDWRDCLSGDGPAARLGALRRIFFAADRTAGHQPLEEQRQRPYFPENARWTHGSVTFATIHVIGQSDGLGRGHDGDAEVAARHAAAISWLDGTFDEAQRLGSAGVVIAWQADPHFGQDVAAYNGLRGALRARTIAFGKPVVLVHGDSGYFRIDKPMVDDHGRRVENFTRVETFDGSEPDWVRGIVDPDDPGLFTFRPEIVPAAGPGDGR
jgi:hypothetical protein